MGLFDKIKGAVSTAINGTPEQQAERQRKLEEQNRTNPANKDLAWFASDVGLEVFEEYTTPQNYFLEERFEKEKEEHPDLDCSLESYLKLMHKEAKVPSLYFYALIDNIKVQPMEYTGPRRLVAVLLSLMAKSFTLDDDGEPQKKETTLTPKEIVSVEKNPVLNFVSNFNCFLLKDDEQGTWDDKYELYQAVGFFLAFEANFDADVIEKNKWIFEKSTYFNDLGMIRKPKAFYKKAAELSSDKEYFEEKYNEEE